MQRSSRIQFAPGDRDIGVEPLRAHPVIRDHLNGVPRDVEAAAKFFRSRVAGNVTTWHASEVTRTGFLEKLRSFFATGGTYFVLYFSGHGTRDGWAFRDSGVIEVPVSISAMDVFNVFATCTPDSNSVSLCLIIDCCFARAFTDLVDRAKAGECGSRTLYVIAASQDGPSNSENSGGHFSRAFFKSTAHESPVLSHWQSRHRKTSPLRVPVVARSSLDDLYLPIGDGIYVGPMRWHSSSGLSAVVDNQESFKTVLQKLEKAEQKCHEADLLVLACLLVFVLACAYLLASAFCRIQYVRDEVFSVLLTSVLVSAALAWCKTIVSF